VLGFAWSDYPESYANGSVGSGRVSHARPFKCDDPDPQGWELGVGLTISPRKRKVFFRNLMTGLG